MAGKVVDGEEEGGFSLDIFDMWKTLKQILSIKEISWVMRGGFAVVLGM